MRLALAATVAALVLAGCGDDRTASTESYTPETYSQQEARRDTQRPPPAEMPSPDDTTPAVPTVPRDTDPLDPTDPLARPPGSPPPVLPTTPPT
jgi:PBP1b-binding outer membrane lipoprotein LpoB